MIRNKCAYCKNDILRKIYPYQLRVQAHLFCSKKHANRYNAKKLAISRIGKGNPMFAKTPHNYKNGVSYGKSGSRNVIYEEIIIKGKRYKSHRLIMEKHIGRKLKSNEVVHHIDGNGKNNNIDNLKIMTRSQHSRLHADVSFLIGGGVL